MINPFSLIKPKADAAEEPVPENAEVVDLADIDLDFAVEEAFRQEAPKVIRPIVSMPAKPEDLKNLELFSGLTDAELTAAAPQCQVAHVVPGYVLYPVGRINTRLYLVIEGQMRTYLKDGSKRPTGIVDMGQSCGLTSALNMQPTEHALIATEASLLLVIEAPLLQKLSKQSHAFANNYMALMASYTKGDHCLKLDRRGVAPIKPDGYIDPDTLLHNQHWLDTMLPRLADRSRKAKKPLSLVMMKVDRLLEIDREAGVVLSRYILESIGKLMMDYSRPTDLHVIDRHQRLLVVLPDSDLDAARILATRLRIQTNQLKSEDLELPAVTLSVAIVSLEPEETEKAMLDRAENLILKSSRAGGNWLFEK